VVKMFERMEKTATASQHDSEIGRGFLFAADSVLHRARYTPNLPNASPSRKRLYFPFVPKKAMSENAAAVLVNTDFSAEIVFNRRTIVDLKQIFQQMLHLPIIETLNYLDKEKVRKTSKEIIKKFTPTAMCDVCHLGEHMHFSLSTCVILLSCNVR
jgi:hypothetical protein